ncbi:ATP-binding protein [Ktedonosporobacter rubrisoli]|uniref:ATP-binding protein n=1 Tax=Ktedonosporobacter rubrisoli TaxID=2509675 RepID=A0A4P6JK47_KTERU|nr:ATP-binding protein [Ktedonosporobacter rubrisoli]QBD75514.1 ATP-binding protein [Ktedonosporobacter rubrisoli]
MSTEFSAETQAFLTSFKAFMDKVTEHAASRQEGDFIPHLKELFAQDLKTLPVVSEQFETTDQPNLHVALTNLLSREGCSYEILGIVSPYEHMGIKLAYLIDKDRPHKFTVGPVEYLNIMLHDGQPLTCIQMGLYLIRRAGQPLALLVQGPNLQSFRAKVRIEVMTLQREVGERFLSELRTEMRMRNVYRGHVISLGTDQDGLTVKFHHLPAVTREDIILPAGILERIERQTIGFSQHRDALLAAGRHLKRGLLLYGPPGTGKTLTALYLAKQMTDRTVILLTGRGIGLLEHSCTLARLLQPATVILEDVDLIAEERTRHEVGCSPLLFELLNQMDGLSDDADILFILTTNRPEILEPALASRPGRIDQASELPLPDRYCRKRLIELYGRGLQLHLQQLERLIDQTEGVSAAFIKEMLRKATLLAADEQQQTAIVVSDAHVEEALKELLFESGELTRQLLGAGQANQAR